MNKADLITEIDKLDIENKISLVADIWDKIAIDNDNIVLPEWQKIELERRYKQYKNGDLSLHELNDVHSSLKSK